jgi:circadian clock protein KaiB
VALRLYVAGSGVRSLQAIDRARALVANLRGGAAELEVVDVLESPAVAERDRILAAPTLMRRTPPPPLKVIGDLADLDELARQLGLDPLREPDA